MIAETIDKLFLELSQITKAKTERELQLEKLLGLVLDAWQIDGVKDQLGHCKLYNHACLRITTVST